MNIKYKDSHISSALTPEQGSASPTSPSRVMTFVTTDESVVIHHYHLKSVVYFRVHCICRIFYGL